MKTTHARRLTRGNPFLKEKVHDPYRTGLKLSEATSCPQCGVRYSNGRWIWPKAAAKGLKSQLCPACRRINDRYPAGEVVLAGSFLDSHRDEIMATAHHIAEQERSEHPLNRILDIDVDGDETRISTTQAPVQ